MANPYAEQLASFQASVPNARRGLRDIYRRRARHYTEANRGTRTDIERAFNTSNASYGAGLRAIDQYEGEARALIGRYGYDVDSGQGAELAGVIDRGIAPIRGYASSMKGLQGQHYKDAKQAMLGYYANLQEGLKREQPAALSELEQGITDTVGFLGAQSSQFAAQQQFMNAQTQFMNQQLTASGAGGGGLSPAEQWIIQRESGGRTNADNPTSTAFGLGQLLIANRRKYAAELGVSPNTTDYRAQLEMMRRYIRDRYGTAEAAMRFWQQNGWY